MKPDNEAEANPWDAAQWEADLKAKTTVEYLTALTNTHLRRYRIMMEAAQAGERGYRPAELALLIKLWEHVERKRYVWGDLHEDARNEIRDAIFSGE